MKKLFVVFAILIPVFWMGNAYAVNPVFSLTTTELASGDTFQFRISASGTFYVDCGDSGTLSGTGVSGGDTITKNNTSNYTYTCTYSGDAGPRTIAFDGAATGYTGATAISFSPSATKIASISGSLGQIFGTIANPTIGSGQPRFNGTFDYASNMTGTNIPDPNNPGMNYALPPTLFDGISGAPVNNMFNSTFHACRSLTGTIPPNLFENIEGPPASGMFNSTFGGCSGLTGAIPPNLFGNIEGPPASSMFKETFYNCKSLTGTIPPNLFGNIKGAPATQMFYSTFRFCSGLTGSIPSGLFGNIEGAPATQMFYQTFSGCTGLTGPIPSDLFSGISGAPATQMFYQTFNSCIRLTGFGDKTYVPGAFLADISTNTSVSNQAYQMFTSTQLASTCPAGTYNSTRTQFNDAGKPWCSECPSGTTSPAGSTSVSQCVETYTVSYACSSGSGTAPANVIVALNSSFTPADNTCPIPDGYAFSGWAVSGTNNVKPAGTAFTWTYNENKTFTAQYAPNNITLTWDGGGMPASCTYGDTFNVPTPPSRTGYVFTGWRVNTPNQ